MFWSHLSASLPFPVNEFLDWPFVPSSLHQFQLTLFGDAGTVLTAPPDKLMKQVLDGKHHLLFDIGARFSATFRFYHRIPLTAYLQAVQPVHFLDFPQTAQEQLNTNDLRLLQDLRIFMGLSMGIF